MGNITTNWGGIDMILNEEDNSSISCFGWFVNQLNQNLWETSTHEVFTQKSDLNKVAIDLGGWIGVTSIYLSHKFKKVISVEADKVAIEVMRKNLSVNNCENVELVEKCVFNNSVSQISFGRNIHHDAPLGSSMSQTKQTHNDGDYLIDTITISQLCDLCGNDELGFIKVDIEGGEENIFSDLFEICEQKKCSMLLSFHIGWWTNKDLSRFNEIIEKNYRVYAGTYELNKESVESYLNNNHFASLLFDFS